MCLYIRRTGSRLHRVYRPSSLTGWSTLSSLASNVGSSKFHNPERLREALNSFDRQNTRIGTDTCASLLQGCAKTKCLTEGRRVHNLIVKNGLQNNRFLADLLVNMYAKCGSLFEARSLFDNLSKRSVFLWTSLIAAYVHRGQGREALRLFKQMQQEGVEPDKFTFTSIVGACSSPSDLEDGRRIHAQISDSGYDADVVLGNAIITMYGKCGSTDDALKAFLTMANRDVVTWNSVIIAHGQSGRRKDAQKLFREMIIKGAGPDEFTFSSILHACCGVEDKAEGKLIHARAIDKGYVSDIVVGNALVNMYNKCKSLEDARRVFDNKCERNLVSWNTIISACAQHGCGKDSLELFSQLQESGLKPNKFILASILNACATPTLIDQGKVMHAYIIGSGYETELVVKTSLLTMYGRCGRLEDADKMFQKMPERDDVSWNAIIAANAQHGNGNLALELYQQMQKEGIKPNEFTFVSVIDACASLAAIEEGMEVHAQILDTELHASILIGNALINFYGKCGNVEDAEEVFNEMPKQNIVAWTAMIATYAQHGRGREALNFFRKMHEESLKPNEVTFVSLLFACSRANLFDEGCHYFILMNEVGTVEPTAEHFGCVIDLLGQFGWLDTSLDIVNSMPFEPDPVIWATLLGACRLHSEITEAECAAYHVISLDPHNPSPYILLANMYAEAGRYEDLMKMKKVMADNGFEGQLGCSSIK